MDYLHLTIDLIRCAQTSQSEVFTPETIRATAYADCKGFACWKRNGFYIMGRRLLNYSVWTWRWLGVNLVGFDVISFSVI